MITQTILDNGLTIVTDKIDSVKTVSLGLWNKVGSRYETTLNNGAAHFLEHMVYKGTKTRDALTLVKQIENVGGYMNAYTSNEITAYYKRVMEQDTALALDITADILLNPQFPNDEMERERGAIIQEIGMYNDDPQSLVGMNVQLQAFADQSLGWNILGTVDTVNAMTRDQLFEFIQTYYVPKNMVLVASGAVDHQKIVDQAYTIFGDLPRGDTFLPSPARYVGGDHRVEKDLEQINLMLAFEACDYHHDDFYAVSVLATIMGDGFSSRLFQEIREKRGLAYNVSSFVESYSDTGLIGFYAGTGPDLITELLPVLCDQLVAAPYSFTTEEIERAKAQFRVQQVMALESTFRRAEKLGYHLVRFGRPISLDEILAKINAVDHHALDRVAKKIFSSKPTMATVGKLKKVSDFETIEKRLAA